LDGDAIYGSEVLAALRKESAIQFKEAVIYTFHVLSLLKLSVTKDTMTYIYFTLFKNV
jgi:hypothetical protein